MSQRIVVREDTRIEAMCQRIVAWQDKGNRGDVSTNRGMARQGESRRCVNESWHGKTRESRRYVNESWHGKTRELRQCVNELWRGKTLESRRYVNDVPGRNLLLKSWKYGLCAHPESVLPVTVLATSGLVARCQGVPKEGDLERYRSR